MNHKLFVLPLAWAGLCAVSGCGGSDDAPAPAPPPAVVKYLIGGTVSGLPAGASVTLANGGDTVNVAASGNFTFPVTVPAGTAYAVTIKTQSTDTTCRLQNGAGTMGSGAVNDIAVSCIPVLLATLPFTPARQFAADYLGNVYLADTAENLIRKLSPTGQLTVHGYTSVPFVAPNAVAISRSGWLYIIDHPVGALDQFRNGGLDGSYSTDGVAMGGVHYNWFAASAYEERAAVDHGGAGVLRLNSNPKWPRYTTAGDDVAAALAGTQGVASNFAPASIVYGNETDSTLYIADSGNSVIYKAPFQGGITVFAGTPGVRGSADGAAGTGSLNLTAASALTIDELGNLYVSGVGGVRKIAPNGTLSTPQLAWGTPALDSITYAKPLLYGRVQNTVIQSYLP